MSEAEKLHIQCRVNGRIRTGPEKKIGQQGVEELGCRDCTYSLWGNVSAGGQTRLENSPTREGRKARGGVLGGACCHLAFGDAMRLSLVLRPREDSC